MDFGTSDDPAVQAQLDRLAQLSLPDGRFGLDTIRALLQRLGDPQDRIPPVFHVAGTNGKGSVCAYLRAMLEAGGHSVHVATSPHLVRYNERIRIAGELIGDTQLAALLAEVLDACAGSAGRAELVPSFFEVTIAATFLAFARTPADACVIEVGLGGRFDATNVIARPAICGIAALGIDHERFLLAPEYGVPGEPIARIAFEKAGIAKRGVPLVTFCYPAAAALEVERAALRNNAILHMQDRDWSAQLAEALHYNDRHGDLLLPLPSMAGRHQALNAALGVAMLRHQDTVTVAPAAMAQGIRNARWPARLQKLAAGPLSQDREIWLDGGHNRDAGNALARHFAGNRLHLIVGMIVSKAPDALIEPLGPSLASIIAVPISTHDSHPASAFGPQAREAASVQQALASLPRDGLPILIAGSLYLAGDVLRANGEVPA